MDFSPIIIIFFFVLFTHAIADGIGRKRNIGYKKTVFWCMMLSPIGGLLIAISSPKLEEVEEEDQNPEIENEENPEE